MRIKRFRFAVMAWSLTIVACTEAPTGAVKSPPATSATDPSQGSYVVLLRPEESATSMVARSILKPIAATPRWVSEHQGVFTADLTPEQVVAIQQDPRVLVVEPNSQVVLHDVGGESQAPWGLDALSVPVDGWFTYSETGAGVNIYIVDLPVNASHVELAPRVVGYFDAWGGQPIGGCTGSWQHGTAVASVAAGLTDGVAKAAWIHSVIVFPCSATSGTVAAILAGLRWVRDSATLPAVANLSFGTSNSVCPPGPRPPPRPKGVALDQVCPTQVDPGVDNVIAELVAKRITVVISAGNDGYDACKVSPADASTGGSAITVGAVDATMHRSWWTSSQTYSNFGSCVTLFAPGSNIRTASDVSTTASAFADGTSMAAPFVAGAAALYLQGHSGAVPSAVRSALVGQAQSNVISAATIGANSPNKFLRYTFSPLAVTLSGPQYASNAYATVVATPPQTGPLYYKWTYTFCAHSSLASDCNGASYNGPSGIGMTSMQLYVNASEYWMTWKVQISLMAGGPVISTGTWTVDGSGTGPPGGGGGGNGNKQ